MPRLICRGLSPLAPVIHAMLLSRRAEAAPPKDNATLQCLLRIACAEVEDRWRGLAAGARSISEADAVDIEPGYLSLVGFSALDAARLGRLDLPTIQAVVRLTGTALKVGVHMCSRAHSALAAAGSLCKVAGRARQLAALGESMSRAQQGSTLPPR